MHIEAIRRGNRARKSLGDLTGLMRSIKEHGLINPITVDERGFLLAGERRWEACRRLGWTEVDTRTVDTLGDLVKALSVERDENRERLAMTTGEMLTLTKAIESSLPVDPPGPKVTNSSQAGKNSETRDVQLGKVLGVGKSTAADLISIARAVQSGDPVEAAAGKIAEEQLGSGRGVQPVAQQMRQALGRTRQTNSPGRQPAEQLKRRDDQQRVLGQFALQQRGIEDYVEEIIRRLDGAGGLSPDIKKDEVSQWVTDLENARRGFERLIKRLRKEGSNAV